MVCSKVFCFALLCDLQNKKLCCAAQAERVSVMNANRWAGHCWLGAALRLNFVNAFIDARKQGTAVGGAKPLRKPCIPVFEYPEMFAGNINSYIVDAVFPGGKHPDNCALVPGGKGIYRRTRYTIINADEP